MKGKVEFNDLKKLAKRLDGAANKNGRYGKLIEESLVKMLCDIGKISLREVKRQMTNDGVIETGLLRRSWYLSDVQRNGDDLTIELYNNVHYAIFVEYGHRTRLGTGVSPPKPNGVTWVEGRFMLTLSQKEVEKKLHCMDAIFERLISHFSTS